MTSVAKYQAIVIGTSAGGLRALSAILPRLPADFPAVVIIVQHRSKDQRFLLEELLQDKCRIRVKQADEKEKIKKGQVYIAPPDYHLLVESDMTFSLSSDPQVNYSRPSIDVLFESAAAAYGSGLVGIVLTGANSDGSNGLSTIKNSGGLTIAQLPLDAEFPSMPQSAIDKGAAQLVFTLPEIGHYLITSIT
jgi:two-component system chemotaxis response regulator CheB